MGRRILDPSPILDGKPWAQAAPELQRFLEKLVESDDAGIPAGYSSDDPEDVGSSVADPGTEAQGWAAGDHVHALDIPSAKGGIITHDGTTPTELAVSGVDGRVLTENAAAANGIEWATVAGGEDAELLAYCALALGQS